jgi:hypothetical protein
MSYETLMQNLTLAVLPVLAFALATLIIVKVKEIMTRMKAYKPDLAMSIERAAHMAVVVVEQLKKAGIITDNKTARENACRLVEKYLRLWGINIDLDPYAEIIVAEVERALREMNERTRVAF